MHFFVTLLRLLAGYLLAAHLASAGPGGYISLINATPYEWRLVYEHQYQMQWAPSQIVAPGTSAQDYFEFRRDHKDEGADAVYSLVGHPKNASFVLQARHNPRKQLEVQYQDGLHSLNNPEGSKINLYYEHNGAVAFILSGDGIDEPFISTNPPVAWMQATLPLIGSRSMREIVIPASHDSGMSEITQSFLGYSHNTKTQSRHVYEQLINGARYFDIRPIFRRQQWYTNHMTWVNILHTSVGGFGRTILNIINDINSFTAEHPGELIILELSHAWDRDLSPLTPEQWQHLYWTLLTIKDIWSAPDNLPEDLSTVPISTFIQPGSKSVVIVRIPNDAPLPDITSRPPYLKSDLVAKVNIPTDGHDVGNSEDINDYPDGAVPATIAATATDVPHAIPTDQPEQETEVADSSLPQVRPATPVGTRLGFFHERRLPQTGSYAKASDSEEVSRDQIQKLKSHRVSRESEPLRSTWTITQSFWHSLDATNSGNSILSQSALAHRVLFRDLWGALTRDVYPNLIEIDNVWNSHVAALCMAINDHFVRGTGGSVASKQTGRLEGRKRRGVRDGAKSLSSD